MKLPKVDYVAIENKIAKHDYSELRKKLETTEPFKFFAYDAKFDGEYYDNPWANAFLALVLELDARYGIGE